MANDCYGTMRVVAKSKETLARLEKIMTYKDDEYFVSRVRGFSECGKPFENDGLWVQDYEVDGAWDCEQFFSTAENKDELAVVGYEKGDDGREDWDRPIHGTAHLTNLVKLTEALDFGCELFSEEPNCGFCEHILCNHLGECRVETDDLDVKYPLDEDGNEDDTAEPEIVYGIEGFNEFSYPNEIYGD